MNAPAQPFELQQRVVLKACAGSEEQRGGAALRTHLRPLQQWLDVRDVTEISVNRPGEVWVAQQGRSDMRRHAARDLTTDVLLELARQVATNTEQEVSAERPLLSAELPNGYRIQFVLPPAAGRNVVLSIRKPAVLDLDLGDYERNGAFDSVNNATVGMQEDAAMHSAYLILSTHDTPPCHIPPWGI